MIHYCAHPHNDRRIFNNKSASPLVTNSYFLRKIDTYFTAPMKSFTATIFVAAAVFLCATSFLVVDAKFDEDEENVGLIQPTTRPWNGKVATASHLNSEELDEDEENVGIQPPTRPWEWEGGNGKPLREWWGRKKGYYSTTNTAMGIQRQAPTPPRNLKDVGGRITTNTALGRWQQATYTEGNLMRTKKMLVLFPPTRPWEWG